MNEDHAPVWRSEQDRSARSDDALPSARSGAAGGFPALGGGGRGVGAEEPSLGVIRPFIPASWFHPQGIFKVLARLMPKLPDVGGSLFITLTFDPKLFADPSSAFERGRERIRRIFYKLRKGVRWDGKTYVMDEPYCVKVEFHENGWAHFHIIFRTRRYLPGGLLTALWGFGRTHVQRISNEKFHYLLKYVTKAGDLPDWIKARSRLRVFQASQGFYVTPPEPKTPSAKTGRKRSVSLIGERLNRWRKTALFQRGDQFQQISLTAAFYDLLGELILTAAKTGRYLGRGHIVINGVQDLIPWIEIPNNQTSLP